MPQNTGGSGRRRRVRVGVKYGDTSVSTTSGQNYVYLVDPSKAHIGQTIQVQVNQGHGLYTTTATVVDLNPGGAGYIRRPRIGK